MAIRVLLAIIASIISGYAFFLYNEDILSKKSDPKLFTWSLMAGITILNFTSYGQLSNDTVVTLLPTINSVMTVFTAVFLAINYFKAKKEFKWPNRKNRAILIAVIIAIVIVIKWENVEIAAYANIATQVGSGIAFIPTILRLQDEDPRPWFMWSGSFLLVFVALLLNWQEKPVALFYPLGGMVSHFTIGVISSRKRHKAQKVS